MCKPKSLVDMGSKISSYIIPIGIAIGFILLFLIGIDLSQPTITNAYLLGSLIRTGTPDTFTITDTVVNPVIHKGNQTAFALKTGYNATLGNIVLDQNGTILPGDKLKLTIAEAQPICISQLTFANGSAITPNNSANLTIKIIPKLNPYCQLAKLQQIIGWEELNQK